MSAIEIVAGAGPMTDAGPVTAGQVNLRISVEPGLAGSWVGLVRLRSGTERADFLSMLRAAYARDGSGTAAGLRIDSCAELLGGGAATPETTVDLWVELEPGPHLLVDYKRIATGADDADAAAVLHVTEGPRNAAAADPVATVSLRHSGAGGEIDAPAILPARRPVLVHNTTNQFNEAVLMRVREDADVTDLEKFFDAIVNGEAPPVPDLVRSQPTGVVPLGPGRSVVASFDVPAGRYALTTWITDYRAGRLFALQGMLRLVDVTGD